MPDWLCVDVMGTSFDVDLSNLAPRDSLLVKEALRDLLLPWAENRAAAVLEVSNEAGQDPVAQMARRLGQILREKLPEYWWLRVIGTFSTSTGDVVLICRSPAISPRSTGDRVPVLSDGGLVGIDAERGVDPVLCRSGGFSWEEDSSDSCARELTSTISRVARIVFAEQVTMSRA